MPGKPRVEVGVTINGHWLLLRHQHAMLLSMFSLFGRLCRRQRMAGCQRQRVPDLRLRLQLMCTYPLAGTKPKTSRDLGGSEGWVTGSNAECTVGLPGRSELMEFEAKLCAWKDCAALCSLVWTQLSPRPQLQGRSSQERNAALSL